MYCSRATKSAGRNNPNTRYNSLDDAFFENIDSEAKAYVLGWIASDGSVTPNSISIYVHQKDRQGLTSIRDLVEPKLPIKTKKPRLSGFTINSKQIVGDVCRWLQIEPGKKSSTVGFPVLAAPQLTWAFIRGLFDGDGSISSIDAAANRNRWPAPRCNLTSGSKRLLDAVREFTAVPVHQGRDVLEWSGSNALDLLGKVYDGSRYHLDRKRDLYLDWCNWVPSRKGRRSQGETPLFRWIRTLPGAIPPTKRAASDSGFDLTLIDRWKTHGAIEFFRTGIRVQPAFGWYFDLVPRSSISKSGYMLANSVGIIDRGYTGEIFVPLVKIDPDAPDLELPNRLVQIIPRQIIAAELVEVSEFDETVRGDGAFGSSGK